LPRTSVGSRGAIFAHCVSVNQNKLARMLSIPSSAQP
jgi:hypothetical protein